MLDFLVRHPEAGWAGIEVKNVRPWLYPDSDEVKAVLRKAVALDCIPVLIARRLPFVTFKFLNACGGVVHQTYNQRLPSTDRKLADKARDKTLLGYHDIRTGNIPDQRPLTFIGTNLPKVLRNARSQFDDFKDLAGDFGNERIDYDEFAARVRRRSEGTNEDHDWLPESWDGPDY